MAYTLSEFADLDLRTLRFQRPRCKICRRTIKEMEVHEAKRHSKGLIHGDCFWEMVAKFSISYPESLYF